MGLFRGSQTEGNHAYEALVQFDPELSVSEIEVPAASGDIEPGAVVNVAGGVYAEFAAGNTDLGIMMYGVRDDATDPTTGVPVVNYHAVINRSDLVWPAAITVAEQDAAIAALWANSRVRVKNTTPSAPIT